MSTQRTRPTIAFLDRDGTIIRDTNFVADPNDVELLDSAADAVARLNREQIPAVLVTNQSGIGRGYFTVEQYHAVDARMVALLSVHGARLDASYYCPDLPSETGGCRKPNSTLFSRAIREHDLDASHPLFVGDRWRDLAPVLELGGTAILVLSNSTTEEDLATAQQHGSLVVASLQEAVTQALG